ncbi:sugar kinase [Fodinisporobacter ferrooxydans]|uniref:Sugar kinase n=1 Tax=Fodinisporobacter ferrooxydans TaxID=2901836 RepID=A0ABY4CFI3_9BACL|nr:sugar kinase [Alicyclobacillaceae bacterium MYW30-H2]
MGTKYIIGVDNGSQSSKVTIFDTEGRVVSEGKQALRPMNLPKPGHVEHPDDDLWESIVIACRKAMENFTGNPNDIIGVGLCTIRFCRALLREDGRLAYPVLSWMDVRVSSPYEHEDDSVRYVTTSSGYITHRFTDRFVDTAANYQGQWPIDTDTWDWSDDPEVIKHFQIPKEMLFQLQMPGTVLGKVTAEASWETGIPTGLPVIATANDKAVEALGSGSLEGHTALVSLGTYIAAMIHGPKNLKETSHLWTNFSSVPNRYLYESFGIRRGMWTVSWLTKLLGGGVASEARELGISAEELLNREASQVPPGCNGLMTVLDWLAPSDAPYKRGSILGFNASHTRAHMYRSILEAIALTMKNRTDEMCQELGIELESLVLSGGGSKSDLMVQIFADVFGKPVSRNVFSDAAGLGSAILVATALGIYDSVDEAVQYMVKRQDTVQPIAENYAFYQKFNEEVYRTIPHYSSDEIYKRAYSIFGD